MAQHNIAFGQTENAMNFSVRGDNMAKFPFQKDDTVSAKYDQRTRTVTLAYDEHGSNVNVFKDPRGNEFLSWSGPFHKEMPIHSRMLTKAKEVVNGNGKAGLEWTLAPNEELKPPRRQGQVRRNSNAELSGLIRKINKMVQERGDVKLVINNNLLQAEIKAWQKLEM